MSKAAARRARPLSPHLTIYRLPMTAIMSIAHRITGGALYFGILLVAWWLIAAATSPDAFALANAVLGSWFGLLVLFGMSWAFYHHALGGIRHFIWDTGAAMDLPSADRLAWGTLFGSILLTVVTWAAVILL